MRLRNNPNANNILKSYSDFVIGIDLLTDKLDIDNLFPKKQPLYIEIGMGKGKFIYENALKYPDINFIGIEKYPSVLAVAATKINSNGSLPNLKLLCFDAEKLNAIFLNNQVDRIYLNFSDPWPKSRHAKRRLTYKKYLDIYYQLLSKEGTIEMKTDNRSLFEFSLTSYNNYGMIFEDISLDLHNSNVIDNIMTEYEMKFMDKGPIYKIIVKFKEKQDERN